MWTLGCYLKRVSNLNLRQDLAAASVCILPSIASRQLKKSTVVVMRNHSFYWNYTNYVEEWGGDFLFFFFFFFLNKVCVGAHRQTCNPRHCRRSRLEVQPRSPPAQRPPGLHCVLSPNRPKKQILPVWWLAWAALLDVENLCLCPWLNCCQTLAVLTFLTLLAGEEAVKALRATF